MGALKNKKSPGIKSVEFDPEDRLKYLKSFKNRKVQKKKAAEERRIHYEQEEKREKRREKRATIKKAINELVIAKDINRITDNTRSKRTSESNEDETKSLVYNVGTSTTTPMVLHENICHKGPQGLVNSFMGMKSHSFEFKTLHSLEDRKTKYKEVSKAHPDRIPIICERFGLDGNLPKIEDNNFLVPSDLLVSQFIYIIRKRIRIGPQQSIFVFFNGALYPNDSTLQKVYKDRSDPDGFLYASYSSENTFGSVFR